MLIFKIFEGQCRCQFEERRMQRFEKAFLAFNELNNRILWNHFSVNPYALSEIQQMWRGEQSNTQTCQLQNRRNSVRARSFSIRSRHVNNRVTLVRMAEMLIKAKRCLQAWFIRFATDMLKKRCSFKEILNSFLICHSCMEFFIDRKIMPPVVRHVLSTGRI